MFAVSIEIGTTLVPVLIALISSGFLFGLVKVLPERKSILIAASENAVKVVNEAVATLQKELTESRLEIARLEAELKVGKENRYILEDEIRVLRQQVTKMEAELQIYTRLAGDRRSRMTDLLTQEQIVDERVGQQSTPDVTKVEADVNIKQKGDQGNQGNQGFRGRPGPPGPQGPQGERG